MPSGSQPFPTSCPPGIVVLPGAKSHAHSGLQSDFDSDIDTDSDPILAPDQFHHLQVDPQCTLFLPGRNCPIMNALSWIKARTSFLISAINAVA
jgi:hypothetical protein